MTFATRTFMGASQGNPQAFSVRLGNNSLSTGVRSATFTLVNDGTTTTGRSPGTGVAPGSNLSSSPWYNPAPTSGASTGLFCKLVLGTNAGTTVSGTSVGSVVSLGGSSWTFSSTGPTTEGSGSATLSIYGDAGGTSLLAVGSVSWDVGYTP